MLLFHIASQDKIKWAKNNGEYIADSLEDEGFIHLSTESQLKKTAERFYLNQSDHLILHIDEKKLKAKVIFEDTMGHGEDFPHLYGPLNLDAIIREERLLFENNQLVRG